jgi:hypothetical protein
MTSEIDKNKVCRVCGLVYPDFYPWGQNGNTPSHDICSCCGTEFGYEDNSVASTKTNRQVWIKKGSNWFEPKEKPDKWSLEEQLKNIPKEYL